MSKSPNQPSSHRQVKSAGSKRNDRQVLYLFNQEKSKLNKGDNSPAILEDEVMKIKCKEHSTQTNKSSQNAGHQKRNSKNLIQRCPMIAPRHKPKKRPVKYMDWKKFHRLHVINSFIDDLERDYPAICTVSIIGKSVGGRSIKMLRISNSNASNKAVWLDAAIHSREWITTAVVTYIADYLVKNFKMLPLFLTNKDWHIVPVLNPDGYEYSHTHDRMWRKNRAWYRGECVGVDLNRNFSYGWGAQGEAGSSGEPSSVFYRGPGPFSEPESTAVRDAILGSTTPFQVFLSFHSYYELIIFPWGCRSENAPDYMKLLEGGAVMARAIFETSGKSYKVGSTKDLTYHACGTSTDWSYSIAKIPYSYMLELRSKKYRFKLPKSQIIETCEEILNAVTSFMQFIDS